MTTKRKNLSITQRGLNHFEAQMWVFTRLSALGMYAFVLFAIIGALVMGARTDMNFADLMRWGFTPNYTHVQSTNVPDLAPWSTPFWKLVASGMLLLAVAHGVHGLVVIADDYISSDGGRKIVRFISIIFMLAMIVAGLYVIWIIA
jgi:succinate dehydrogenase hydrophobic anchor subunit